MAGKMIVKTITLIRTMEVPLLTMSISKLQQPVTASAMKKRGQMVRTTALNTSPVNAFVNIGAIKAV